MKGLQFSMRLVSVAMMAFTALTEADDKALNKQLAGNYTIVQSEKSGQETAPSKIDAVVVRITDDTIVATDKDKKEVYAAKYKIDGSKKPAVITMTSTLPKGSEATVKGLIKVEDETVHLVYNLAEDAEPPKEFTSKAGQVHLVMKKAKAAEGK